MSTKTKRFKVIHRIRLDLPEMVFLLDAETMDEAWDEGRKFLGKLYPNGRVERIENP